MSPEVARAVEEIRAAFPGQLVNAVADGDGGAWVVVDDVCLGDTYAPSTTWVGFRIAFQYPYADVYPHFIRSDLLRADGRALGEGTSAGSFPFDNRPAIQVSRRSSRWDAGRDTAAIKLLKVVEWLRTRP
jgi:hypothetical protein